MCNPFNPPSHQEIKPIISENVIEETWPFITGQLGGFEVKDCAHETKGIQGLEVKVIGYHFWRKRCFFW